VNDRISSMATGPWRCITIGHGTNTAVPTRYELTHRRYRPTLHISVGPLQRIRCEGHGARVHGRPFVEKLNADFIRINNNN
jgi:hypothetical protein